MASLKPTELEIKEARARVLELLERFGLLLCHDAELPSATTCISGVPIRGSWWGHPKGALIYEALGQLESVATWVKLVAGKDTLVHRRLWPALIAAARSGQAWQHEGLKHDAEFVLELVKNSGKLRSDELELPAGARKIGTIVTDLERRLLVRSDQEHTESGYHVRIVEPWSAWQKRVLIDEVALPKSEAAIEVLTAPVRQWVENDALNGLLPWFGTHKKRRSAGPAGK
jgi:hypothetical protein